MTAHDHFEELLAAYAIGALSDADRRACDEHLAGCAACRQTLIDLLRVSAGLGLSVDPVEPPASLRARTLERATASPRPVPQEPSARAARPPGAGPVSTRPPSWWAVAASVAAVGLALYAWSLAGQLEGTRQMLTEATERLEGLRSDLAAARADAARMINTVNVLRSASVIRVNLRGPEGPPAASARVYLSGGTGLVLVAERLPTLAPNRSYQLWVIPPGAGAAPRSGGVFSVDQSGNSLFSNDLPGDVTAVSTLAVTEEPAGGSAQPTSAPILIGTVAGD